MQGIIKNVEYRHTIYIKEETGSIVGDVIRMSFSSRWVAENKLGQTWEFDSRDAACAWLEKLLEHNDYK